MGQYGAPFTIEVGDEVTIKCQGLTLTGKVLSANYWGDEDGWYIEFKRTTNGAYGYWKQGPDGGKLLKHNGKEI